MVQKDQAVQRRPVLYLRNSVIFGQRILSTLMEINSISGVICLILICKPAGAKVEKLKPAQMLSVWPLDVRPLG